MGPSLTLDLAQRVVPGTGSIAIHRQAAGLVNETFKVERDGRCYSLRVAIADARDLGFDHVWESSVLEAAAPAGLAPTVEYCDAARGVLVAQWVNGRSWNLAEVRQAGNVERLARLARRIHALPVPTPARVMSPAAWVFFYRGALHRSGAAANEDLRRLHDPADALLDSFAVAPPSEGVLCHSDLHAQNLIDGARGLLALDWEYAHVSEPFWDLAAWIANNDFAPQSGRQLLEAYLGRAARTAEWSHLRRLVWAYDYVCLLWSALYLSLRTDGATAGIAARAELLTARLVGSAVVAPDKFRHTS